MDPQAALLELRSELEADGIRVVIKRGWFWSTLHYIILVVTLGGNRRFLQSYYTTIGPWIGVPQDWELSLPAHRYAVLQHERVHVRQARSFGLGNAIAGLPLFFLFYVLVPLPIGLAYFRYRFERVAYVAGIKALLEYEPHRRAQLLDHATRQLTGGEYAWTAGLWPGRRRVRAWFERAVPVVAGPWVVR